MEMRKCIKGHYYDASIHSSCPYCKRQNVSWTAASVSAGAIMPDDDERTLPLGYEPTISQQGGEAAFSDWNNLPDEEDRTVAKIQRSMGIDPVVGWLVCTRGKEKGRDYRLHSDNNFIGRSGKMDICVPWDETISRENHAMISFDSLNQTYYVSHGSGRGIVRLNGTALFQTAKLQAYDEIVVGETWFLFIPLCNEKFDWIGGKQ